jgi:glutamate racemase
MPSAPRPLAFVHGADGIARRVAVLTRGQPRPEVAPEGIAVFTSAIDVEALRPALTVRGLSRIERL